MPHDFSLGLKLFTNNVDLYKPAQHLLAKVFFNYIELYTPPNSETFLPAWVDNQTTYIIHGPHLTSGVNWADHTKRTFNRNALATAQRYADKLHAQYIIIHGGAFGPIDEVSEQIHHIVAAGESRLLLENTPKIGIDGTSPATVFLPEHQVAVQKYVGETKLGLVLDIGHAIYSANACSRDRGALLRDFIALKPKLYHLSDGEIDSQVDVHKNIGAGAFDFRAILELLPYHARITLETPKDLTRNLADTRLDAERLRAFYKR